MVYQHIHFNILMTILGFYLHSAYKTATFIKFRYL